ncbi:MAG: hypothetical protein ACK521_03600 [bacterium]|jgi:hypothetical protein
MLLHIKTNNDIYNSGKERVKSYFDIIPFIRQFREMQIFISTVLTHRQRLLLLFQRKMLISEVEEEHNNRLEQENKQYDIKRKILSSKGEEIEQGLLNMRQILQRYTNN